MTISIFQLCLLLSKGIIFLVGLGRRSFQHGVVEMFQEFGGQEASTHIESQASFGTDRPQFVGVMDNRHVGTIDMNLGCHCQVVRLVSL